MIHNWSKKFLPITLASALAFGSLSWSAADRVSAKDKQKKTGNQERDFPYR